MIHQYQQHVACQRLCSIICHQLDRQLVASIQHLHLAITQTASSVNHIKKKTHLTVLFQGNLDFNDARDDGIAVASVYGTGGVSLSASQNWSRVC